MTAWPEARALAHGAGRALPAVRLALADSAGLVLADDLRAQCPLPPFDAAAMDGWAVSGIGPWTVVGCLLAGDLPWPAIVDGEAVEIATGAVVPVGTDRVIPYEVGLLGPPSARRHIRFAGEECQTGDLLLPAGTALTPAAVGLAAATGSDDLLVRRAPEVTCLVTGTELLLSGLPEKGQVRDAVGPLLVPALRSLGATVLGVEHLTDDRGELLAALSAARGDLVITTGASSQGPADHLGSVLLDLGAQVLLDGVAVQPGHPQVLARLPHGPLLIGLPGNPLAALAGIVTLVAPLLAGLSGRPLPGLGRAVLSESLDGHATSHRLVPVTVDAGAAVPTGHGGAAMLRGAALATAFAVLPPGAAAAAGDPVALLPLP